MSSISIMKQRLLILALTILIPAGIFGYNYVHLEYPLSQILEKKPQYRGIQLHAYYYNFITPSKVILDVMDIDHASAVDVMASVHDFAVANQNKQYQQVILAYKGNGKYALDGQTFQKLSNATLLSDAVKIMLPALENMNGVKAFSPNDQDVEKQFETFTAHWYGTEPEVTLSKSTQSSWLKP